MERRLRAVPTVMRNLIVEQRLAGANGGKSQKISRVVRLGRDWWWMLRS